MNHDEQTLTVSPYQKEHIIPGKFPDDGKDKQSPQRENTERTRQKAGAHRTQTNTTNNTETR